MENSSKDAGKTTSICVVTCPVCGAKVAFNEKLYVTPFYTISEESRSFAVVAKGVCWECFKGRVLHGDDYRPGKPRGTWTQEDAKRMHDALWHISNSVSNGGSQVIRCDTTEWLKGLITRFVGPEGWIADGK